MFNKLDHLIVAVKDLQEAENNYQKLFGMAPVWSGTHKELGTSNSLFNFQNTYFELLAPTGEGLGADLVNYYLDTTGEGLIGMVFATEDIASVHSSLKERNFLMGDPSDGVGINSSDQQVRKWKNLFLPPELTRGVFSFVIEHTQGSLPQPKSPHPSSPHKLDHVVINIEHWQKRMLFFRLNKTTIEVIEQEDDLPPSDKMWGLAWDVQDIEKAHQRLLDEGIEVTPVQKGVKEKTLVATVKSHTQNVPTLLIQHLN